MRRVRVLLAVAVASLSLGTGSATATDECRGLMVCVPVAGPWVLVPTSGSLRPRVEYELRCPRRYVVGGLDAEPSHRSVDVSFTGQLGSPVNPGITTTNAAVFAGVFAGAAASVASFRPHIGCIPAAGGGGGSPPFMHLAAVAPRPTIRRVSSLRPVPGRTLNAVRRCGRGERLVGASHAVGFFTRVPPRQALAASVAVTRTVRSGRISVAVRATRALRGVRAIVQIHAVCTRSGL